MSGFILKALALFFMIIDHTGAALLMGTFWYLPCRILGRIAFPLYAFLITEGYVHTRSVKKYAGRLFCFALLSELPFDYAFYGTLWYPNYQNVFFTLVLGLAALICYDAAVGRACSLSFSCAGNSSEGSNGSEGSNSSNIRRSSIARALILLILVGAEIACTDYGAFGILLILLFYHFRGNKRYTARAAAIAIAGYSWLNASVISGFALLAIPFILLYNGKKGRYPLPSLLFYAAYPIHLLILGILLHGM